MAAFIVERSLYERANGYSYDAVKIFMPAGSKQPVIVHYTEHCPPDVGAAFIWLKNRDPDRWRDVQNVEHVLGKYIISDRPMTVEQWAAERATVVNDVVEELPAPEIEAALMLDLWTGISSKMKVIAAVEEYRAVRRKEHPPANVDAIGSSLVSHFAHFNPRTFYLLRTQ